MQGLLKGALAGIASGVTTYFASNWTLGFTNALVMPAWAPLAAWEWIVLLGLGATVVAFALHLAALGLGRASESVAFAAFFGTTVGAMLLAGLLESGAKTLAAWLVGAFLASWLSGRLRSRGRIGVSPLRGPA